jgi:hypothetical protein
MAGKEMVALDPRISASLVASRHRRVFGAMGYPFLPTNNMTAMVPSSLSARHGLRVVGGAKVLPTHSFLKMVN